MLEVRDQVAKAYCAGGSGLGAGGGGGGGWVVGLSEDEPAFICHVVDL